MHSSDNRVPAAGSAGDRAAPPPDTLSEIAVEFTPRIVARATIDQPKDMATHLDARVAEMLEALQATDLWGELANPMATPEFIRSLVGEVYLEVFAFQSHVLEACIRSVAEMECSLPVRMIGALLRHQADDFERNAVAVRDCLFPGHHGSAAAHLRAMNHECAASSTAWHTITSMRDPFAYLGALYPFEGLTPAFSAMLRTILSGEPYLDDVLECAPFESAEDIKHANLLKEMIEQTVQRFPAAEAHIKHGLDAFLQVYPLPVWNAACERAKQGWRADQRKLGLDKASAIVDGRQFPSALLLEASGLPQRVIA